MNTVRLLGRIAIAFSAAVFTAAWASGAEPVNGPKTPLDEYIAKADPAYEWKVVNTIPGDGCTTFIVDLKSQSWRTMPEVDRAVWEHWLVVVKPDAVKHPTAFLTIGGRANGSPAPKARQSPEHQHGQDDELGRRGTPDGPESAAGPQPGRQAALRGRPARLRLGQVHADGRPAVDHPVRHGEERRAGDGHHHGASGERSRAARWT